MKNVLVVTFFSELPLRMTIWEHLYSFQRYGKFRYYYINLAEQKLTEELLKVHFDAIIFHTLFFSVRWERAEFLRLRDSLSLIRNYPAVKIAMPQDEFIHTDLLNDFINSYQVDLVYSMFKSSEWRKVYSNVDFGKVRFKRALTGYVDEHHAEKVYKKALKAKERPIDISYRAWHAPYWLGRHGQLKVDIAKKMTQVCERLPLITDISTKSEDTICGLDWYCFLMKSRCVLGVEGGASILDADGLLKKLVEGYVQAYPEVSFEEAERACFEGRDGELDGWALSPRHLEACFTRTCQVLVEGEYNNVLYPMKHYIPIKKDFSNIDSVLEMAQDTDLCEDIVDRCYKDIVQSGRYTYRAFVREVESDIDLFHRGSQNSSLISLSYCYARARHSLASKKIFLKTVLKRYLSRRCVEWLKGRK